VPPSPQHQNDAPAPRDLGAPISYFSVDAWPYGPAQEDAPRSVLYAAEFAAFIHTQAKKYGKSLNDGLAKLQAETGLSSKSLRPVADGARWPGLALIAQVEEVFLTETTGYGAVLRRVDRLRHATATALIGGQAPVSPSDPTRD
jgi:hypothetical protein